MKLVYWPLPGRAHVSRAILHYHGIPFEDLQISSSEWKTTKLELAEKIKESDFKPDAILGISRGGCVPGMIIHEYLNY